jgi:hypothetical protein
MSQSDPSDVTNGPEAQASGLVAGFLRVTRENGAIEDVPFTGRIDDARLIVNETPEVP